MDFLSKYAIDISKGFQEVSLKLIASPNNNDYNNNNNRKSPTTDTLATNTEAKTMKFVENSNNITILDHDINELSAKEFTQMASEERTKALHDLHGVADVKEENEEENRKALDAMRYELVVIRNKPAYDVASLQSYKFVNDESFRLMFLRAEEFNAKKAAQRFIRYFEEKRTLFGDSKLTKFITLADMDDDDIECLKLGPMQVLPSTDRSGRLVLFTTPQTRIYKTLNNLARALWYTQMVAYREMSVKQQQMGLVTIGYDPTGIENNFPVMGVALLYHRCAMALPFRLSSMHFCIKEEFILIKLLRLLSGKAIRGRSRTHFGLPTEIHHQLLSYGIITEALPVDQDGNVHSNQHLNWMQNQIFKEEHLLTDQSQNASRNKQQFMEQLDSRTQTNTIATMDNLLAGSKPCVPLLRDEERTDLANDSNYLKVEPLSNNNHANRNNRDADNNMTPKKLRHSDLLNKLGPFDVPFGRGSGVRTHSGYIHFHSLVDLLYPKYVGAETAFEKTAVAELIMKLVHEKGGKFMLPENSTWVEATHGSARKKVIQCLRTKFLTATKDVTVI